LQNHSLTMNSRSSVTLPIPSTKFQTDARVYTYLKREQKKWKRVELDEGLQKILQKS
jgi:hypothetical protein